MAEVENVTETTEAPKKTRKKLSKDLSTAGLIKLTVVDGVKGEMVYDFAKLPKDIQTKFGPFGAGHWATLAAMVNNAIAFYLIFELIKRAGPVFFSMVNYVATLVGMGLGIWS